MSFSDSTTFANCGTGLDLLNLNILIDKKVKLELLKRILLHDEKKRETYDFYPALQPNLI
jgi:hypothetical protein